MDEMERPSHLSPRIQPTGRWLLHWFKAGDYLVVTDGNGGWSFDYNLTTPSKLTLQVPVGGAVTSLTSVTANDGNWHLLGWQWDGADKAFFSVDGILETEQNFHPSPATTQPYSITIIGKVTWPRVWNRTLTPVDWATAYSLSPVTSGLVFEYQMTEGSGSTIADEIGGKRGTANQPSDWNTDFP